MYYYGARWYDAALGRFIQADTIVPLASQGVQAWDRYAYVNNNALRYIDPSGFRLCQGEKSDGIVCDDVTTNDLEKLLSNYDWKYEGKEKGALLKRQLEKILAAAQAIESYVDRVGGWGVGWIRNNIGNAIFHTGPIQNKAIGILAAIRGGPVSGVTPWKNQIWLPSNFSVQIVVHELGHVLDNNYWELGDRYWPFPPTWAGGGLADFMVSFMGGDPSQCIPRWSCAGNYSYIAGKDPWKPYEYGSTSIADDFAETFMNTIFGYSVPEGRLDWMENFLRP